MRKDFGIRSLSAEAVESTQDASWIKMYDFFFNPANAIRFRIVELRGKKRCGGGSTRKEALVSDICAHFLGLVLTKQIFGALTKNKKTKT